MSGIEVAGLLLGTFPLLISALEHYRQTAEVLEDWWQIKREYKKCKNEIKIQELAFESNLERFLLPLVVDDDEIIALMKEPGGPKWKDPALEDKLKSRLPKSYDLFLDTIHEIQATVDGLKDELGVSRDAFQRGLQSIPGGAKLGRSQSPLRKLFSKQKQRPQAEVLPQTQTGKGWKKWLTQPNIEYQTQRIKFGFGRANRAKLFEEFARYNGRLRELLDTSEKSTALKQSREQIKKSSVQKVVWGFWRHAAILYRLLDNAWCCQCKRLHRVQLLLHHGTNVEGTEYSFCFLYAASMVPPLPWTSIAIKARRIDKKASGEDVTLTVPQTRAVSTSEASLPSKTPCKATESALRSHDASQLATRPKVNWADTSAIAQSQETGVIHDICSSIAGCNTTSACLGILQGDQASYKLQGESRFHNLHDSISLETLLNGTGGIKLDRRQRYAIAFTLVSSHLQLYPSPWLCSHWSKKDIVFLKDGSDSSSIQVERPYMLRNACSPQALQSSTAYASSDRVLPTLGILLIELCFGSAIENHEMRRHYHASYSNQRDAANLAAALDLAVALEWSRSVGGEAGDSYADAVHWCLRGQVGGVKDDKWRQELFTNVVLPLQYCYEQLYPRVHSI